MSLKKLENNYTCLFGQVDSVKSIFGHKFYHIASVVQYIFFRIPVVRTYRKSPKNLDTQKNGCNGIILLQSNGSKQCRRNDSVDPDQNDLGLHCLIRPVCPKTWDHYGTSHYHNMLKYILYM